MLKTLDTINRILLFLALIWLALSLGIIVILIIIKTFFKITYISIKNKLKFKK